MKSDLLNRIASQLGDADRISEAIGSQRCSTQVGTRAFEAPRTPTQEALAAIWAKVLKITQVGIKETLFDLGGHSLSAVQIGSRVRDTFKVDISLREWLSNPTVEVAAAWIDECIEVQRVAHFSDTTLKE